jgi:lipopolysaccharide transport system ATP-binding protein
MPKEASISLNNVSVFGVDTQKRASTLRQWFIRRQKLTSFKIPIIQDLSLDIKVGERVGILGSNGSGKSSLLKVISGNYPIHKGRRTINGKIVPLIEMGAGFDPELTGRRNIQLSFVYRGKLKDYNKDVEEQIIEFAELKDKIDFPLKTYSSGMQTRLAFSSAIFQEPEILLLDEIFAAGDAHFKVKSAKFMEKKWEQASISLIVSHSTDEVTRLCNRCILMHKGRLIADGTPQEVEKEYFKILAEQNV